MGFVGLVCYRKRRGASPAACVASDAQTQDSGIRPGMIQQKIVRASRDGDVRKAEKWVSRMRDEGFTVGTVTYTTLIHAYRRAREPRECLAILERMMHDKVPLGEPAVYECIRAAVEARDCDLALEILSMSESHSLPVGAASGNAVVRMCAERNRLEDAERTVRWMRSSEGPHPEPDIVTYNILITAYAKRRDPSRALAVLGGLLCAMERKPQLTPTVVTFNTIFTALHKAGKAKARYQRTVRSLLALMRKLKVDYDVTTATTLIQLAGGKGATSLSAVFGRFVKDGTLELDKQFFDGALQQFARSGDLATCRDILERMSERGVQPDVLSYNHVLRACSRYRGNSESDARALLVEMTSQGHSPDLYTYCALLDAELKRSGAQVVAILQEALDAGIELRSQIQCAAVTATYDSVEDAEQVWRFLRTCQQSTPADAASYKAFLRVCGSAGRSDMAVRVVYAMQKEQMRPDKTFLAEFNRGARDAGVPGHRLQPYLLILRTLCGVADDLNLPIERIRIRY